MMVPACLAEQQDRTPTKAVGEMAEPGRDHDLSDIECCDDQDCLKRTRVKLPYNKHGQDGDDSRSSHHVS
jgi:hypothetical protein